jgi:hypothetical protein
LYRSYCNDNLMSWLQLRYRQFFILKKTHACSANKIKWKR